MNPEAKTFADKTFDDYTNDINIRFAVERPFSIIDEAMNGLAHHARSSAEKITA